MNTLNYNKNNNISNANYNFFDMNTLSYNKNYNIDNIDNFIFEMNTLNYKKKIIFIRQIIILVNPRPKNLGS
jgi:hypothetical protein